MRSERKGKMNELYFAFENADEHGRHGEASERAFQQRDNKVLTPVIFISNDRQKGETAGGRRRRRRPWRQEEAEEQKQ